MPVRGAILGACCSACRPRSSSRVLANTVQQLLLAELTIAAVLGAGVSDELLRRHRHLGLAFAATGAMFPFFSALLGWLGVFLTGSDTSANALFGNLQVVTAQQAGHEPGADGRGEFQPAA